MYDYVDNLIDSTQYMDLCQNNEQSSNIMLGIVFPTLLLLVGNILVVYHNTKLVKENHKLKNIIRKILTII